MTYVHHVPGRLRVRAACVKGGARPNVLEQWLQSLPGVERVDVSRVTGSVLIHYRVGRTDANSLLALMRERGCIGLPAGGSIGPARAQKAPAAGEHSVANIVIRYVVEIAIERCLLALYAAVL